MGIGKAAAQAGHAYLEAIKAAQPDRVSSYSKNGLGTKICLQANSLTELHQIYTKLLENGFSPALIEDTGRNTIFNGVPTITAVGVGPVSFKEVKPILGKIPLFN